MRGGLSLEALEQALEEAERENQPFGALHLLCHGAQAQDGTYGLVLNTPRGGREIVDALKLRRVIAPHARTLRLVVLCMCHGSDPGPLGSPLGSVALELHKLGVQAVIGSRAPLSKRGSVRFTEELYRAMFERRASLYEAFQVARNAPEPSSMDRASLQLYARWSEGADLRPFERTPAPASVARPKPIPFSSPGDLPLAGQSDLLLLYQVNAIIQHTQARAALEERVPESAPAVVLQPFERVGEHLPDTHGWPRAFAHVDRFVAALDDREVEEDNAPRYHLFGRAPLPLMFYLGHRLALRSPRVYQQRANGGPWELAVDRDLAVPSKPERFFQVGPWPDPAQLEAAQRRVLLPVEVSREVSAASLAQCQPTGVAHAQVLRLVAARGPSHTAFQGPLDAARATAELRDVLDRLYRDSVREVHLLLACPAGLAAALGAAINPKAQPTLVLHNFRESDGGYVEVYRFGARRPAPETTQP